MDFLEINAYNLKVSLPIFLNIIGPPSSGKTRLLKMLINKIPNMYIYLDDKLLYSYDMEYLKHNICVIFQDFTFNTEYVNEELVYYQKILNIEDKTIFDNVETVSKYFNISEIMETKVEYLTLNEKALIKILSFMIFKPRILGLDNMLAYLNEDQKKLITKYAKEHNITIINVTTNSNELLINGYVAVLRNGKVIEYDTNKKILANEKLLSSIGYKPPFVVELSNGLKYYNLTSKIYYDSKSLVGYLWK